VRAFIDPPPHWMLDKNEAPAKRLQFRCCASSTLGRNREKYINEFFEELNRLRSKRD
jgi:hypothetical protein